jgi:uncharacterized protein YdhG (YjbR/CyaY superfamily)
MPRAPRFVSHGDYFEQASPLAQLLLASIQTNVEAALPGAERCIGYNMPAYRQGRVFFFFAAFKRHIGVYPPVSGDADLIHELQPYRGNKGNLSFSLHQPLPLELVVRVAVALHKAQVRR